jgi:hypothetical protein
MARFLTPASLDQFPGAQAGTPPNAAWNYHNFESFTDGHGNDHVYRCARNVSAWHW